MSEKKSKVIRKTIDLPVYDVQNQMQYLIDLCKDFEFEPERLLSLILADWICTVQKGLAKGSSLNEIFISYLESSVRTEKDFKKLKEYIQNGKDNTSH